MRLLPALTTLLCLMSRRRLLLGPVGLPCLSFGVESAGGESADRLLAVELVDVALETAEFVDDRGQLVDTLGERGLRVACVTEATEGLQLVVDRLLELPTCLLDGLMLVTGSALLGTEHSRVRVGAHNLAGDVGVDGVADTTPVEPGDGTGQLGRVVGQVGDDGPPFFGLS
ncbi:MAG TPA: hypothetical protein VFJ19_05745 [Nocardioidaceae bacterium]|nr:hypothetical protein [Nocardioidaceae bacterium]